MKLNLDKNICYDRYLLYQIDPQSYGKHTSCVRILQDHYQQDNIAVGMGISELMQRLAQFIRDHDLKCSSYVDPWLGYYDLNLPIGDDVLYIVNPNGINGSIVSKDNILSLCSQYELVIIDEAYGDFATESIIDCRPKNAIVLKTLSKSIALPGARFGWCFADKEIIQYLDQRRPRSSVVGGLENQLVDMLNEIPNHVDRMLETKDELKLFSVPSHGNYVIFKEENLYTDIFNCNRLHNRIRMALMDIKTLNECTRIKN